MPNPSHHQTNNSQFADDARQWAVSKNIDLAACQMENKTQGEELPNGYVPPTRVDFSLPKIQNRPQILKLYSRTGPTFWSFTPEQDPFLTIWSQGLVIKYGEVGR